MMNSMASSSILTRLSRAKPLSPGISMSERTSAMPPRAIRSYAFALESACSTGYPKVSRPSAMTSRTDGSAATTRMRFSAIATLPPHPEFRFLRTPGQDSSHVPPIPAELLVHEERHAERVDRLHRLAHQHPRRLDFAFGDLEEELVV